MKKLNIHVLPHQPARSADFNAATGKIDELVDAMNELQDTPPPVTDLTGYYKVETMDQSDLEEMAASDCQEGVLYLGLGEVVSTERTWRFDQYFPIVFA